MTSLTGEVALCIADLSAVGDTVGIVTPDEHARASRLRSPAARRRFIARRRVRRALLARATASAAETLVLEGPPGPLPAPAGPVWWSSSSSGDTQVLGIAGCRIGVDVERIDPSVDWQAIARRFFTDAEHRAVMPSIRRFFEYWTIKEAFLKAMGGEVPGDLGCLDCTSLELSGSWSHHRLHPSWRFHSFSTQPGVVGAVAIRVLKKRLSQ